MVDKKIELYEKNAIGTIFKTINTLKENHEFFGSYVIASEIWISARTEEEITLEILKSGLTFLSSHSKLMFKVLIVRILLVNCQQSTMDSPDLDGPLLIVNN